MYFPSTRPFINVPVIGITGRKQSGKNWFADQLASRIHQFGYESAQVSFAAPLKLACHSIFGWNLCDMESERFKSTVDPRIGKTPRQVLQLIGTEFGRQMICDTLWVDIAREAIKSNHRAGKISIVTDLRFDNEAALIKELGGKILRVVRPDQAPATDTHVSEAGITCAVDAEYVNDVDSQDINARVAAEEAAILTLLGL
ncbi:putative deoxynucleotide monophosphate kinase [Acidovorax phage ACP17]|uniref:Putative deoxynucleotide monophosphate kinase n=1 Tax=Acidovorax phage ACP17 TaxID=2010329 RepID=A0A218M2W7_9CAUD|nr:putative deoxynucleotide monophosphate kinase [Acidovorax phage ACP17]ASD50379.1 putative deoxynucleotide monophosphate kinase [Acidovorax phage ACP17]